MAARGGVGPGVAGSPIRSWWPPRAPPLPPSAAPPLLFLLWGVPISVRVCSLCLWAAPRPRRRRHSRGCPCATFTLPPSAPAVAGATCYGGWKERLLQRAQLVYFQEAGLYVKARRQLVAPHPRRCRGRRGAMGRRHPCQWWRRRWRRCGPTTQATPTSLQVPFWSLAGGLRR